VKVAYQDGGRGKWDGAILAQRFAAKFSSRYFLMISQGISAHKHADKADLLK